MCVERSVGRVLRFYGTGSGAKSKSKKHQEGILRYYLQEQTSGRALAGSEQDMLIGMKCQ
jgi:hypothetical protein